MDWSDTPVWFAIGFAGQTAFFSRFLVQWIASERQGRSVIPTVFWYLSLVGSTVLLVYAIHRKELVFMLGQTVGAFVYIRNLMLIRKENGRKLAEAAAAGSAPARTP